MKNGPDWGARFTLTAEAANYLVELEELPPSSFARFAAPAISRRPAAPATIAPVPTPVTAAAPAPSTLPVVVAAVDAGSF